jgi:hypothetical protein
MNVTSDLHRSGCSLYRIHGLLMAYAPTSVSADAYSRQIRQVGYPLSKAKSRVQTWGKSLQDGA